MIADGRETKAMRLATEVIDELRAVDGTLAAAESLTGGGVCATLTGIPGASDVVVGCVVSYATAVKRDILGVDADLLSRRGAVDAEVAEQMARGVADLLGTDWAVATTGSAGPEPAPGGSETEPVEPGMVFLAIHSPYATWVEQVRFAGDRDAIRTSTIEAALQALLRTLRR